MLGSEVGAGAADTAEGAGAAGLAVVDGGAGASGTGVGGAFSSAISASHLRIHRFSSRPSPLSSSALANAARDASYSPSANDACPLRWKALGVASSFTERVASETASV